MIFEKPYARLSLENRFATRLPLEKPYARLSLEKRHARLPLEKPYAARSSLKKAVACLPEPLATLDSLFGSYTKSFRVYKTPVSPAPPTMIAIVTARYAGGNPLSRISIPSYQ